MITKYNDNELLYLISEKNEIAFEILLVKYRPLIINRLQRFRINPKNFEDFYQECVMELYRCALSYREDKSYTFNKYFDFSLQNRIRSILRSEKNYFYNVELVEYEQLDYNSTGKSENMFYYVLKEKEFAQEKLYRKLSPLEKKIFDYLDKGYSVDEIARIEKRDSRSIYNAITRMKTKEKTTEKTIKPVYVSQLSSFEMMVFELRKHGKKPKEISLVLNVEVSRVYNALKRIKNKSNNYKDNGD